MKASSARATKRNSGNRRTPIIELKLYVAGQNAKIAGGAVQPQQVCKNICRDDTKLQVIDLVKKPQLAKSDQILAIPTLVRKLPMPIRKNYR
jgi:circadian clock protein KaiB